MTLKMKPLENIVGKEEKNGGYQHFFSFPTLFSNIPSSNYMVLVTFPLLSAWAFTLDCLEFCHVVKIYRSNHFLFFLSCFNYISQKMLPDTSRYFTACCLHRFLREDKATIPSSNNPGGLHIQEYYWRRRKYWIQVFSRFSKGHFNFQNKSKNLSHMKFAVCIINFNPLPHNTVFWCTKDI